MTVCAIGGPLVEESCPAGGPDHEPMPASYLDWHERAEQLTSAGWVGHECPDCDQFTHWIAPPGVQRPPWPPTS